MGCIILALLHGYMDSWDAAARSVFVCVCVCQLGVASASTEPCWGFVNSWLTSRLCCSENLSAVKPWDDAWMCAPQQIPSWGLTGSDTTWSLWWGAWRASEGFLVTAFHILCTHSWCTYDLVWLAGRCFVLFIWFEGDYWVWDRMSVSILAVLVNIAITIIWGQLHFWLQGNVAWWARTTLYLMGGPEILRSKPQKHLHRTYLLSDKHGLHQTSCSLYCKCCWRTFLQDVFPTRCAPWK